MYFRNLWLHCSQSTATSWIFYKRPKLILSKMASYLCQRWKTPSAWWFPPSSAHNLQVNILLARQQHYNNLKQPELALLARPLTSFIGHFAQHLIFFSNVRFHGCFQLRDLNAKLSFQLPPLVFFFVVICTERYASCCSMLQFFSTTVIAILNLETQFQSRMHAESDAAIARQPNISNRTAIEAPA